MQEISKNKITLPELNEIWLVYKRAMSPNIWPFEELTMQVIQH